VHLDSKNQANSKSGFPCPNGFCIPGSLQSSSGSICGPVKPHVNHTPPMPKNGIVETVETVVTVHGVRKLQKLARNYTEYLRNYMENLRNYMENLRNYMENLRNYMENLRNYMENFRNCMENLTGYIGMH
jgi:hypothetical protein